jgi:hypothetical protein
MSTCSSVCNRFSMSRATGSVKTSRLSCCCTYIFRKGFPSNARAPHQSDGSPLLCSLRCGVSSALVKHDLAGATVGPYQNRCPEWQQQQGG